MLNRLFCKGLHFLLKSRVPVGLAEDGMGVQEDSALGGWSLGLVGSSTCMYLKLTQLADENWKGTNHK